MTKKQVFSPNLRMFHVSRVWIDRFAHSRRVTIAVYRGQTPFKTLHKKPWLTFKGTNAVDGLPKSSHQTKVFIQGPRLYSNSFWRNRDYRIRFRSYETPRNEQITPKNRKLNPRGKGVSEKHHFFRAKIALNP